MRRRLRLVALLVGLLSVLLPPAAMAKPPAFKRLFTANASTAQSVGIARAPNGTLHLIFQTFAGRAFSGLAAQSISASGFPGPLTQATTWPTGQPGLVAYPNGTLQAFFGAISPGNVSSVWAITSNDGGSTWSVPVDVRDPTNTPLAYGSDITSVLSAGTPVLSLPQAGNLVVQRGLGQAAPTYQVTNTNDGATTDADMAVDAASGQTVAGWKSIAHNLVEYMQAVSPTLGGVQAVPGQDRNALILSGRDKGAGVFGAYTPDNRHVRLLRYGGGSVAVGSLHGVTPKVLGTATGLDGRIWVMWGTDSPSAIAVTRSNRAVTRFEPIQRLDPKAAGLSRVSGDGRLGPLDLLVNELPETKGPIPPVAEYYAHVLPVLSARVKSHKVKDKQGHVIAHLLSVTVTDAGDAVGGAKVKLAGKSHKTNKKGKVTVVVPGGAKHHATLVITAPGYALLKVPVRF